MQMSSFYFAGIRMHFFSLVLHEKLVRMNEIKLKTILALYSGMYLV